MGGSSYQRPNSHPLNLTQQVGLWDQAAGVHVCQNTCSNGAGWVGEGVLALLRNHRIGVACVAEGDSRLNDDYSASSTEVCGAMSVPFRVCFAYQSRQLGT